jgi:glycosyltransferase involved in cell wall biosynthesis
VPDISIVIPIHNEEFYIESSVSLLLSTLNQAGLNDFELILAENGSTDNTLLVTKTLQKRFEEIKVVVLDEADYGAALREGMVSSGGNFIIMFDLDYWDVTFLRKTVLLMRDFEHDVIIGSKNLLLSKDERRLARRLISQIFRLFLLVFFRMRVSDTHGVKAFRNNDALKQLIKETKFTRHIFDTELVLRCQKADLNIIELPITVVEKRPSSNKTILKRIPEAVVDLIWLWWELNVRKGRGKNVRNDEDPGR